MTITIMVLIFGLAWAASIAFHFVYAGASVLIGAAILFMVAEYYKKIPPRP